MAAKIISVSLLAKRDLAWKDRILVDVFPLAESLNSIRTASNFQPRCY